MTVIRPTAREQRPIDPENRADTAITELLTSVVALFAIASDRRTHQAVAVQVNDIELAYSRLGRLVALLRAHRIEGR
jgi:hypothetical protein